MADVMVNNKQVNFWRGDQTPPTIYHIWIRYNREMLLYDGTQWVVFLDNKAIIDTLNDIQARIDNLQSQITSTGNYTVNSKAIKTNPVLNGTDIPINTNGTFVQSTETVAETINIIDKLLTTQIIE